MIKLTVITINYNNANGLKKTMDSVFCQNCREFEYVVIDGGSTDGSRELIESMQDKINYWVSEKDQGIYNAMNKGIMKSNGKYLLFLNSGDSLIEKNVLKKALRYVADEDIVYGNGQVRLSDGKVTSVKIPSILSMKYFMNSSLFHPSTFIKRDLFQQHGLYNESNKVVSDWEFFILAIIVNNAVIRRFDFSLAEIEDGGISRDARNRELLNLEIEKVHRNLAVHEFMDKGNIFAPTKNWVARHLFNLIRL
jgi:glycosyltransferase involved in cell wall biosynthesis